ncbi:serine/threonine-protein kinase [soil metagenome]
MNLCGFTDSLASAGAMAECPRCHTSSRVAQGLCLGCLLHAGEIEETELRPDEFDAALAAVPVADTNWRLGNYEILEEIGRGGMGVIYRARQRHSRRIVALKRVLSYHADSQETLKRFRREAEAAASLDHPNILPIYEVGESDEGVPYFTMKYAPGGSLQEVGPALRNNPREIVRLLAEVTRAVQAAHRQGILHRDLKPGNILLDGRGEPLVSDFGLAKWLDTSSDITRTLTIFGTPGFIAPEQAEGKAADLKPAADIYSLGAILFNLLAGRPPFLGEHALAVIHQAAEKSAPKLRSLVGGVDRDLETICARCLERDPEARYHSAGDLAEDLERWLEGRPIIARPVSPPARIWRWSRRNPLLAGSVAATLLVVALAVGRQVQTGKLAETVRQNELATRSIAVLPFLNLDTIQPDGGLAGSFAQALAARMAALGGARVVAKTDGIAATPGAGTLADLREIEHQAGVHTVMTGTLRRVGDKCRISLRLSHAQTGEILLARVIDTNPSAPASEVADLLAKDLFAVISGSQPRTAAVDPAVRDPAANEFLRAGDELLRRRTVAEMNDAMTCYRRAFEIQPKSAVARASFVIAAVQQCGLGQKNFALLKEAETYGREAVALNEALDFSHRALGALYSSQGRLREAREESLRTIEAGGLRDGPNSLWIIDKMQGRPDLALRWAAIANHWNTRPADGEFLFGDCWVDLVDDEKAETSYRRMSQLHPEIPEGWMGLCRLKLLQGDFPAARRTYQENIGRFRDNSFAKQMAAQVEFFSRNFAKAEKLYRELGAQDPGGGGTFFGCTSYQSVLGRLQQLAGDEKAKATLQQSWAMERTALLTSPEHPETLYRLAAIESSLGEMESSVAHLKQAFAAGWLDYRSLRLDPRFDAVHDDPTFSAISEAMATRVASLRAATVSR